LLADQVRKQALYGATSPLDEDFLAALEAGLEPCPGIALGFDRLVTLVTDANDIEEVLWGPRSAKPREFPVWGPLTTR
jgi:elongation factor P--(R)-beta-lysine ligase